MDRAQRGGRWAVDEITATSAVLLADLALQARVCALENFTDWTNPGECDLDARAYRRLVDNIMAMVGSEALPGVDRIGGGNFRAGSGE